MSRPRQITERYWRRRVVELATFLAEEALSPDVFPRFLEMLAPDFPGSSSLLDYDAGERRTEFAAWRIDAVAKRAYSQHFHAVNPFTKSILTHQLYNHTFIGSHVIDHATFPRTEFYNDWLLPRGERYLLVLSIGFDDGGRTGFPIYRGEAEGGEYTSEDARRLDMLRPFLKNTLLLRRLYRQFREAELPIVAANKNGLDSCNDAGERLLMESAIWRCHQIPLRPLEPEFGGVVVPSFSECSKSIFIRRYGLSQREADVATLLCDGFSYRETADRLGISFHTVNAYVKSLLRKLDLSSTRCLSRLLRDEGSDR
jgi:DNA-binding CsgD family transcriptional regulator